jgi:redox-sensitive bicupin YhaK (pirin superfamily)
VGAAELTVLQREGNSFEIQALDDGMILFPYGEPIDEPVVEQESFVMDTRAEIAKAFAGYRSALSSRSIALPSLPASS